jgi:uncharacterized protein (TIGR02145 family)
MSQMQTILILLIKTNIMLIMGIDKNLLMFRDYGSHNASGLGYGYLYNWYAANHTNFAPTGWHAMTAEESQTLWEYIDPDGGWSSNTAGGVLKEIGLTHWNSPNTDAVDTYGIGARGSGLRDSTGVFESLKEAMVIWTYYEQYDRAIARLYPSNGIFNTLDYDANTLSTLVASKEYGNSVWLVKDDSTNPGTLTDEDGNGYTCITIGSQVIVSGWKCTKLNDGTSLTNVTDNTVWSNAVAGDYYYSAYDNDESNV